MCAQPIQPSEADLAEAILAFGLQDRVSAMRFVDSIEAHISALPQPETPLHHLFTDGMYVRTIFIPAGTILTSRIHKTQHPFVVHSGDVEVWTKETGLQHLRGVHLGVTQPDTRRILYTHTDVLWSTFHINPDNSRDVSAIEERILEKRGNPQLPQPNQLPCHTSPLPE